MEDEWDTVSTQDKKKFLNDCWEHGIKPQFENQKRAWLVDLPDGCHPRGEPGSKQNRKKRSRNLQLSSSVGLSLPSDPMCQILTGRQRRDSIRLFENHSQD